MWWPGYRGEKVVILDEYAGQWHIMFLLQMLDRYTLPVEPKGGSVQLQADRFIITSNLEPGIQWYPNAKQEHLESLARRFTKVVEIKDVNANYDLEF